MVSTFAFILQQLHSNPLLLGGFNHQWEGLCHILWKINTCSKPPTSLGHCLIVLSCLKKKSDHDIIMTIIPTPQKWSGNPPTQASLMSKLAWKPGLCWTPSPCMISLLEGTCHRKSWVWPIQNHTKEVYYFQIQFKDKACSFEISVIVFLEN